MKNSVRKLVIPVVAAALGGGVALSQPPAQHEAHLWDLAAALKAPSFSEAGEWATSPYNLAYKPYFGRWSPGKIGVIPRPEFNRMVKEAEKKAEELPLSSKFYEAPPEKFVHGKVIFHDTAAIVAGKVKLEDFMVVCAVVDGDHPEANFNATNLSAAIKFLPQSILRAHRVDKVITGQKMTPKEIEENERDAIKIKGCGGMGWILAFHPK